jgi:hypothetical protein
VLSLKKNETIDGDQLREIIHAYEDEHGIESLKKKKTKETEVSKEIEETEETEDEK